MIPFDPDDLDTQPFVSTDEMRYAPTLPTTSLARGLRLRPRRVMIRQWVLPPDVITRSGLYKPVMRYKHPRVWGWLLAATTQDIERYGLQVGAFYHYKRFADVWIGDDAFPENTQFTFDVLPIAVMHLESMYALVNTDVAMPAYPWELAVTPKVAV